ncbi:YdcF family protein [Sedimenticola sp.]|uniref:YdcF family protein n=1 Tax=Sedimenticola sp. TaxID=1940285 RepID=UPI003D13F8C5
MTQEIVWVLKTLILPPGILILLGLVGLMMGRRLIGKLLLVITLSAFYLLSTNYISGQLMASLETVSALTEAQISSSGAQAIVVLGAGRHEAAPEYNHRDTLNSLNLERVRYAAWLSHKSGLPIIPSGGSPLSEGPSEAALAQAVLEQEFGAKVLTLEEKGRTTREEALALKPLLHRLGIRKILLVTHAWHMLRALDVFEAAGITVQPAPTGFVHGPTSRPLFYAWLPDAKALLNSYFALHEHLGRLWYRYLG